MDEPIPLSALQHYVFCPRQCALIHAEQTWEDNRFTARGTRLHERVDSGQDELRDGLRIRRALPLYSDAHGLTGRADVVEVAGGTPQPVEYKSGRPKTHLADHVQLCAQGLCLEEMFGQPLAGGVLYYVATRRRVEVPFTPELRAATLEVIAGTRAMLDAGITPPPVADERCKACSLIDACLPYALHHPHLENPFVPLEDA